MTLTETAFAKLNLALHVRGRRADGYHDIETLFVFADFGDKLTVRPANDVTLEIEGPFGAGLPVDSGNLVLRAAQALAAAHGISTGAALRLDKRLPVAAGIGGGSADAAAALRLLSRFWGLHIDAEGLRTLAAMLGADVPVCVESRAARGDGAGERLLLLPADALSGLPVLLVNPGVPLGTGAVFAGWDGVDRGPLADLPPLEAAHKGRNDLEAPALALCAPIRAVLAALAACPGAVLTRMSGSGATCFALFAEDGQAAAEAARASLASARPEWWVRLGRLR